MSDRFFEQPILNSPYEYPLRHWELDAEGQPTQRILEQRRPARFVTPIPKSKRKRSGKSKTTQVGLGLDEGLGLSTAEQQYELTSTFINDVRRQVDAWRQIQNPADWQVTYETARLLQHWRNPSVEGLRPFFCQIEAAETVIWLTEVAPNAGAQVKALLTRLQAASAEANPDLARLALKLATGAGKTTVMAMLIAWQTVNAVRHPQSPRFTKGFLVVTPGITIKDRLRVLQPNDPDAYYAGRGLVPSDMLLDLQKARIVVTNYHAFKRRERFDVSKGGRQLLQGRTGEPVSTIESEGQMLQRVMPELMGMKNLLVINDEAHHCYRAKPPTGDDGQPLTGDEKREAEANNEAARVWISGLEAVQRQLGVRRVLDLSATPFFLQGSGYAEGTLFPWTACDFSLMDAIECGIVKLPRVPVSDNIPGNEMPMFRNLWDHIGKDMPKKARGERDLDPEKLPIPLSTALTALYGHYEKTFELWRQAGISVPPCFIVVCNNTATSKAVYDLISGYVRRHDDGTEVLVPGKLELFRNFDQNGNPLPRPNTLLIDSQQLESGDALDPRFRAMAADEIERFRREIIERTGDPKQAEHLSDQDLLREVMNTVGKESRLGEAIRCVVSVSMLTEGWDANTVTHVLGVRAFGTQLLCEQVIGRALRRQSYDLNEDDLFNVEYADVLGIPFDFTAKPVVVQPKPPRQTVRVHAVRPERDHLEITFPRIQGYRVELPNDVLRAEFTEDSTFVLTPEHVGATQTENAGIIGESIRLDLIHTGRVRASTVAFELTAHLIERWRDPGASPPTNLFPQLKRIARHWLDHHLVCQGGTFPAQLLFKPLAEQACDRILDAILRDPAGAKRVRAIADAFSPTGSTAAVNFTTSREARWTTRPDKSHINLVILDSDWEAEFCRAVEGHPRTIAYVKNHSLGFEVPYQHQGERRIYRPDFIVQIDDGRGHGDPLHLIVEIKGYRGEDAKDKKSTMLERWVPGVNNHGAFGRWAFAEFTNLWTIDADLTDSIEHAVRQIIERAGHEPQETVSP